MRRAVFLDRDGTITADDGYFSKLAEVKLIDGLASAISKLNEKFLVVLITNQPIVARGLCSEDDVRKMHDEIVTQLGKEGAWIDAVYFCPHHPEHHEDVPEHAKRYRTECECRKPAAGMIFQAAKDLDIDIPASFFVGDSTRDIKAAENADCTSILVKTGLAGQDGKFEAVPDYVCESVIEAADLICRLSNVKAVILAGGKGERLRPLTLDTPKPMLDVAGKPILEHQIGALKRSGITDIVLCTHYLSDNIRKYFGDGEKFGVRMEYPFEPVDLSSGGTVRNARHFLSDAGYLIILNGDSMISGFDFRELVKFHVNQGAFATLLVRETDHPLDSDVVELDEGGRIVKFIGRGQSEKRIANSGIVVCSPEFLDCIPDGRCSLEQDVIFKLIGKKDLYGFMMPGHWFKRDIGTFERLEAVRKHFAKEE